MSRVSPIFADDRLLAGRASALRVSRPYPALPLDTPQLSYGPAGLAAQLVRKAAAAGAVAVLLDSPLEPDELLRLGKAMGSPIVEHDPHVQKFLSNGFVLNLRTVADAGDVHLQPFSHTELLLHTEASLRPRHQRPRWIVLQCVTASQDAAAGQTVIAKMADVEAALSPEQHSLLLRVRRVGSEHPVATDDPLVFAFRDPAVTADEFEAPEGGDAARAVIHAALTALYRPEFLRRVPWRPGVLAIIDNEKVFHGRTAGTPQGARHLQRIRVAARGAG